jgi:hypothetical protein
LQAGEDANVGDWAQLSAAACPADRIEKVVLGLQSATAVLRICTLAYGGGIEATNSVQMDTAL